MSYEEGLEEIMSMLNKIYNNEVWPEDFVKTVMIPLTKKVGTKNVKSKLYIACWQNIVTSTKPKNLKNREEEFSFKRGKGSGHNFRWKVSEEEK